MRCWKSATIPRFWQIIGCKREFRGIEAQAAGLVPRFHKNGAQRDENTSPYPAAHKRRRSKEGAQKKALKRRRSKEGAQAPYIFCLRDNAKSALQTAVQRIAATIASGIPFAAMIPRMAA